ncbi:MAG: hypothetical protein HY894_07905 [Deltaproteobacteria bacterium]|nr:hypothetical protein [Deltaproteobacteria bacterium]
MTDFETVSAITENMAAALQSAGIRFTRKGFDDIKNVPATLLPLGEIFYNGETFEVASGERPGYAEAEFTVRVVIGAMEPADAMREQQRTGHGMREALNVSSLNAGSLAADKPVSRVRVERLQAENHRSLSPVNCKVIVRYREAA